MRRCHIREDLFSALSANLLVRVQDLRCEKVNKDELNELLVDHTTFAEYLTQDSGMTIDEKKIMDLIRHLIIELNDKARHT